jgi:hypothetical protein
VTSDGKHRKTIAVSNTHEVAKSNERTNALATTNFGVFTFRYFRDWQYRPCLTMLPLALAQAHRGNLVLFD